MPADTPPEDPAPHSLKTISPHMVSGAAWMVGMRWALRGIGFLNTLILARLLTPDDFGVIAMGMIIVTLVQMMTEANVDIALLREKTLTRGHYDTAWLIRILSGTAVTALLILLAPAIAGYYGDERVEIVLYIIGLRAFIIGFENIGVTDFRRDLDFAKEFRYSLYHRLTVFIGTLALVLYFRDYWALVGAIILDAVARVLLSFIMSPYRPRLSTKYWHLLWSFSKWQMLINTCRFITLRGDEFVVGGVAGTSQMGTYYLASDISAMPAAEVVQPISRAMTPSYARIAHAPDELRQAFRKVLGFCALVSISTSLGLGAVADDFVKVVLGDQWLDSIPFFKWLTVFAAIHGVTLTVVPYLNINHRERALGLSWLGYALVFMPVLAAVGLMTADLEQIAIARTLLALGFCIWIFSYISLYTPATASDIIQELWRPVLAGAAMVFAVRASHDPSIALPVLSLMRDIIVGASVFGVVLCALWMLAGKPSGAESFILNRLFEKVKGKSST